MVLLQKTPDVRYSSKETGKLILEGFPGTIEFLALLWAQFRKEFLNKRYEVGATAIFKNNEDSIMCTFLENCAYAERNQIEPRIHAQRFNDTFNFWITDFVDLIEKVSFELYSGEEELEVLYKNFPNKRKRDARKASKQKDD